MLDDNENVRILKRSILSQVGLDQWFPTFFDWGPLSVYWGARGATMYFLKETSTDTMHRRPTT